jgi:predicted kinase
MSERPTRRREFDADRLEKALGRLPRKSERPAVIVLIGLPGSGKSHFAREVARRTPAAILDSDALRQVLFANPRHTQQEHGRLFPAIHTLMARLLARGITVIVDATNLKAANRRQYHKIAKAHGADVLLVHVWAPRSVILQRLQSRAAGANRADRSTATLAVYEEMRKDAEPIRERHLSVNTAKDTSAAVDKLIDKLSASKA